MSLGSRWWRPQPARRYRRSGGMHKEATFSQHVRGRARALTIFHTVVLSLCRRKRRRPLLDGAGTRATRRAVRLHERRPKTVLFRVQDALLANAREGVGGRQKGRRLDILEADGDHMARDRHSFELTNKLPHGIKAKTNPACMQRCSYFLNNSQVPRTVCVDKKSGPNHAYPFLRLALVGQTLCAPHAQRETCKRRRELSL